MIQNLNRMTNILTAAGLLSIAGLVVADAPGHLPGLSAAADTTGPANRSVHTSTSQQYMLRDSSGQTVDVRVVDGEVFVKVNGKNSPALKLADDWDRVTIRSDQDGQAIATVIKAEDGSGVAVVLGDGSNADLQTVRGIRVPPQVAAELNTLRLAEPGRIEPLRLLEGFAGDFIADARLADLLRSREFGIGVDGLAARVTPPRTMLGITMSEREGQPGVLIASVVSGAPAEKAGLQTGDVIVEVVPDGPANAESVRRIARDAVPGEPITLRIMRNGETKEIVVELAPYDGSAFGIAQGFDGASDGIRWRLDNNGLDLLDLDRRSEELARMRVSMQGLLTELAAQQAALEAQLADGAGDAMTERIRLMASELDEAMKDFAESQLRYRLDGQLLNSLRSGANGEGEIVIGRGGGDRTHIFARPPRPIAPPAPVPPASPNEQRIQTIESRLDALEASNKRIEQMLQRLLERESR